MERAKPDIAAAAPLQLHVAFDDIVYPHGVKNRVNGLLCYHGSELLCLMLSAVSPLCRTPIV